VITFNILHIRRDIKRNYSDGNVEQKNTNKKATQCNEIHMDSVSRFLLKVICYRNISIT